MNKELLLEWEKVTYTLCHRSITDDRFDFFRFWWEVVTDELTRQGIRWGDSLNNQHVSL